MAKQGQTRFQVVLDGIPLTAGQQRAIREGIQKVVMDHLAGIDLGGDRSAAILPLAGQSDGNGGTQGIAAVAIRMDEIRQTFPSIRDE